MEGLFSNHGAALLPKLNYLLLLRGELVPNDCDILLLPALEAYTELRMQHAVTLSESGVPIYGGWALEVPEIFVLTVLTWWLKALPLHFFVLA
jgi:hypothetical protein